MGWECVKCGYVTEKDDRAECPECGSETWRFVVTQQEPVKPAKPAKLDVAQTEAGGTPGGEVVNREGKENKEGTGVIENVVKECPKCSGKMARGSEQTLDKAFNCTRGGTEGPRRLEKYNFRIQPYCCENCGYIEFYKEKKGLV